LRPCLFCGEFICVHPRSSAVKAVFAIYAFFCGKFIRVIRAIRGSISLLASSLSLFPSVKSAIGNRQFSPSPKIRVHPCPSVVSHFGSGVSRGVLFRGKNLHKTRDFHRLQHE
jgi:hypothetical protein